MSVWKDYITHLTTGSKHIEKAAICKLEDGELWARSEGQMQFQATADELKSLATQMADTSEIPPEGVTLETKHYVVTRAEDNFIFGKNEAQGIVCVKTARVFIVVVFYGGMQIGHEVRKVVDDLAEFLKNSGF